jgi:NADPH2:quinone reductase
VTEPRKPLAAVRAVAKASSPAELRPELRDVSPPVPRADQALVRVASAGVNPSDVKAMLGLMPQAVFPRTPGRDFAGTVVDGPAEWVGKEVWGSGGDLGITRDGSHAGWLLLPAAALRAKPARLSFDEAGSVGVPFVTAYEGFRRSGLPQRGQTVAVLGANGKVGQAAVQLAAAAGATVFAVQRQAGDFDGHAATPVTTVDARTGDVGARLRDLTGGRGIDIAFNTVGSPYFEAANKALAKGGTQIFISTVERPVPFDIFAFYRGMHTFVGIDTLALDADATVARLAAMTDAFESGALRPFAIEADAVHPLADALAAYRRVIAGDMRRVVLRP